MPKKKTIYIYVDGGARGNPGPAGVGVVLLDEDNKIISEISEYIGTATNNVAEYSAIIHGMQEALRLKLKNVIIKVDSQLIARQLKGEYKVKNANLKKFFERALNLMKKFDTLVIIEIPREENKLADKLVNRAINLKI